MQAVMENVALAAVVSTDEQKQELAAKMQAAKAEQMAMAQAEAEQRGEPIEQPTEEELPQEEGEGVMQDESSIEIEQQPITQ